MIKHLPDAQKRMLLRIVACNDLFEALPLFDRTKRACSGLHRTPCTLLVASAQVSPIEIQLVNDLAKVVAIQKARNLLDGERGA